MRRIGASFELLLQFRAQLLNVALQAENRAVRAYRDRKLMLRPRLLGESSSE
jgi:hypothetical protein